MNDFMRNSFIVKRLLITGQCTLILQNYNSPMKHYRIPNKKKKNI